MFKFFSISGDGIDALAEASTFIEKALNRKIPNKKENAHNVLVHCEMGQVNF